MGASARGRRPGDAARRLRARLRAVLVILLVAAPVLAEDVRVATLPVRSRPPEELAEELRSMAGAEVAIAVVNGSLVVRATPTALARIEKALDALDPPPRPLWIAVDQETGPAMTGRSAEFTVDTRENGVVDTRRTRTLQGGSVSTDQTDAPGATERLRILEGHAAFVRFNRAVPVPSSTPAAVGGTVLEPGKTYVEADLAFAVVPRLRDGRVTLEITAINDTVDNRGAVEKSRARATVSGSLGEWLDVGDAIRSVSTSSGSFSGDQRLSEVGTLRVRVEEAR